MTEEMLDALDEVYANANRLVAGVRSDQWEDKTPCTEWNVRDLVQHMTGTSRLLRASATRTDPDPGADDGVDPAADFSVAAAAAASAWRTEGAVDGMVSVPAEMPAVAALGVNILDIGIHAWDLATATEQDHGLAPEIVALIDDWSHQVLTDDVRAGGGFGETLDPASDDDLTRMLAFVGRRA
jgi:uncharacterized protein (TIGR03086 family)